MSDKVDAWQMEITSITWEFEKITENLELDELNFKPHPNSWSMAENLLHLIRLNSSYFPIFDQIMCDNYRPPFLAKLPFLAATVGKLLYGSMNSKTKVKTFAIWEPSSTHHTQNILQEFNKHQMELSAYIQKLEPFFEKGKIIHSPANKLLVYELDKAIDILIAHEKRHLRQCKTILPEKAKSRDR